MIPVFSCLLTLASYHVSHMLSVVCIQVHQKMLPSFYRKLIHFMFMFVCFCFHRNFNTVLCRRICCLGAKLR